VGSYNIAYNNKQGKKKKKKTQILHTCNKLFKIQNQHKAKKKTIKKETLYFLYYLVLGFSPYGPMPLGLNFLGFAN
jgi:hypothetical protein